MLVDFNEIKNIYEQFIVSKFCNEYLSKYEKLPLEQKQNNWDWDGKDFSRVISLLEFKEFFEKNNIFFNDILVLNGIGDPELNYIKYKNIFFLDYKNDIETDLHVFKTDKKYDFLMTNQTLEHTYDPCLILKNLYNIMNKNGIVYFNVPSLGPPHNTPHHHYNGFTPVGLGSIIRQAGFKLLDVGFWGNKEYVKYLFEKNDWPDYKGINNYKNDFNYSVISWAFAIKEN